MTMWCLSTMLLLVLCLSTGLAAPSTERRQNGPMKKRHSDNDVGLQAVLALVQHQSSAINRLQADLKSYEDQLQNHVASHKGQGQGEAGDLETFKKQMQEDLASYKTLMDSKLHTMEQKMDAKLQAMQHEIDAVSGLFKTKVGFMTSVGKEHVGGSNVILKLDNVQYNEGNAYNPGTGHFIAPVAGMYTFFIKTEVGPGKHTRLGVMKESTRVLYIYGHDHQSFQTPSAQVVLHLAKGERVWVETLPGATNTVSSWTRFGGFLVHPDA